MPVLVAVRNAHTRKRQTPREKLLREHALPIAVGVPRTRSTPCTEIDTVVDVIASAA